MTYTLKGNAHFERAKTNSGSDYRKVYIECDEDIQMDEDFLNKNHFSLGSPFGQNLFDFNNVSKALLAGSMSFRQPVEVTIAKNKSHFWTLVSLKVTGTVCFAKGQTLFAAQLAEWEKLTELKLPEHVTKALAEDKATVDALEPGAGVFKRLLAHKHGPWSTATGRPEDLIDNKKL